MSEHNLEIENDHDGTELYIFDSQKDNKKKPKYYIDEFLNKLESCGDDCACKERKTTKNKS